MVPGQDADSGGQNKHRGWGMVAQVLGAFLLFLGGVFLVSFVADVLSEDSEVMGNVVGNLALLLALVAPSFLGGFYLFRWGRGQRRAPGSDQTRNDRQPNDGRRRGTDETRGRSESETGTVDWSRLRRTAATTAPDWEAMKRGPSDSQSDRPVIESARSNLSVRDIAEADFSTSLRGYDLDEVDALLERVAATLARRAGSGQAITAEEVERATFSTTLRGYDLDQVDHFLDEVVATLRHHESGEGNQAESTQTADTRAHRRLALGRRATTSSVSEAIQPFARTDHGLEPDPSSRAGATEPEPGFRPRSTEERLDQAKKWIKRSTSE